MLARVPHIPNPHWPFEQPSLWDTRPRIPRDPTGLSYCDYHWQVVIGLRNNLQAYGEARQIGLREVRIQQFF